MKTKPEIKTKIYSCCILFEDIAKFIKELRELEDEHEFNSRIYFYTKDGSTYSYKSAKQLIDPSEPHNLDNLRAHEIIVGLDISNDDDFRFYISKHDGKVMLSKTFGSAVGQVFVDCLILTLKLRTFSVVGWVGDHFWPIIVLQFMAIASGIIYDNQIYAGVAVTLNLLIIIFSMSLEKCTIAMGTNKDSFWIRKKDDIIIAIVSLVIGFGLGLAAPSFLKVFN
jgi:hypothetical protein